MKLDLSFIWQALLQLLTAVPTTIAITAVSIVCGLVIGTVVALIRINSVPVLNAAAVAYVTFIRGTPMLTHLLLVILVSHLSLMPYARISAGRSAPCRFR